MVVWLPSFFYIPAVWGILKIHMNYKTGRYTISACFSMWIVISDSLALKGIVHGWLATFQKER